MRRYEKVSKALLGITFAIGITCMVIQINRASQISDRGREIAKLRESLQECRDEQQKLQIQQTSLRDLNRIRGLAKDLHMISSNDAQIYFVSLPEDYLANGDVQTISNMDDNDT